MQGTIIVRVGKADRYREVPVHPELRRDLGAWLDERADWPAALTNPALLLSQRGGRAGLAAYHVVGMSLR